MCDIPKTTCVVSLLLFATAIGHVHVSGESKSHIKNLLYTSGTTTSSDQPRDNKCLLKVSGGLQDVWIHIHGDSSMRMFTAALISRLNGTLMDTRFGSYTSHDKGGCQGEDDPQDACFREYLDFSRRVRLCVQDIFLAA